jgi:hypothetical protein
LVLSCYRIHHFKETSKDCSQEEIKKEQKITMDAILDGLLDLVKVKVGQCSSSKEIWDKLHNLYYKESLLVIIELEHVDQNKEDVDIEREEIISSCQTELEEEIENDKEDDEEGEVDLEEKLISSLSELKRERRENKSLKEELIKLKEGSQNPNKNSEEVVRLKIKVKEEEKREEILTSHLK